MTAAEGFRQAVLPAAIRAVFPLEPPGWTRLEPQSVSGDPTPGLEARLADPLWLLGRQWQLGEFAAEDAGSPVAVTVTTSTTLITAWLPGDPSAGHPPRPLPASGVLEPAAEREPTVAPRPTLTTRAEAGGQLLIQLADAGVDIGVGSAVWAAVLNACPLAQPWHDDHDPAGPALLALLGGRVPDGEAAALQAAPGLALEPVQLPPWLASVAAADAGPAAAALADWLAWYREQVVPEPDPDADCWVDDRLEYRFGLVAGGHTFRAPAFGGGRIDWHSVDATDTGPAPADGAPAAGAPADGAPADGAPADGAPTVATQTMLANPLRFAGMPADRYWQFEDGQVNLGALEVQPHDLARLLLVEFATVYGNDWLVAPVDVPGSYTEIPSVTYTTTFGETKTVAPADDSGRRGRFRLFEISRAGSTTDTLPGLLVPPAVAGVLDGPAIEDVLYLRDEMANKAWAVERIVETPSGETRSRYDEGYPPPFTPRSTPGAELDYLLQTDVPAWWIPFLPVATGYRTLALRKGAMLRQGVAVEPVGVLLRPGQALVVRDEEVPREGLRVRRVPTLARGIDGSYLRWTTRRVTAGRGEGSSGLAFDSTIAQRHP